MVSGYDRSKTEITLALSDLGSQIIYDDEISLIKNIESVDLVVYTPAISSNNIQLNHFTKTDIPIHKRAYVLGEITNHIKPLLLPEHMVKPQLVQLWLIYYNKIIVEEFLSWRNLHKL